MLELLNAPRDIFSSMQAGKNYSFMLYLWTPAAVDLMLGIKIHFWIGQAGFLQLLKDILQKKQAATPQYVKVLQNWNHHLKHYND